MRFSVRKPRRLAVGAFVVLILAVIGFKERIIIEKKYEDVMLRFAPSAVRANGYAVKHFDARLPLEYDVDRAYRLFELTRDLDPKYPAVNHQLGRIEFLRGHLKEALALLDTEFVIDADPSPSSYYVRALIKGYLKDYLGAAADYEAYFKVTSANWAAINDYSWVLMEAGLQPGALEALNWGLLQWPGNPWLLNNRAIALYELKRYKEAHESALMALDAISKLTEEDWYMAYPGNDPKVAASGLATFQRTAQENFREIAAAYLKQKRR